MRHGPGPLFNPEPLWTCRELLTSEGRNLLPMNNLNIFNRHLTHNQGLLA